MQNRLILMRTFIFTLLVGLVSACAYDDSSNPAPNDTVTTSSLLNGSWKQDCQVEGTSSSQRKLTMVSGTGRLEIHTHANTSCTSLIITSRLDFSYVLGSTIGPDANMEEMDSTSLGISYIPKSQTVATAWNQAAYCGYTDWFSGVAKDVSGKTCGTTVVPATGQTGYTVISLQGSRLYLGSGVTTAGSANLRSTALDLTPYSKE